MVEGVAEHPGNVSLLILCNFYRERARIGRTRVLLRVSLRDGLGTRFRKREINHDPGGVFAELCSTEGGNRFAEIASFGSFQDASGGRRAVFGRFARSPSPPCPSSVKMRCAHRQTPARGERISNRATAPRAKCIAGAPLGGTHHPVSRRGPLGFLSLFLSFVFAFLFPPGRLLRSRLAAPRPQ